MAQEIDFTIRAIEAIRPPAEGRVDYRDTKTPGLYLRVTHAGVKTFSFVGRAKGSSRVERATFGRYPTVKPEEARRRAAVLAGELAAGASAADKARARREEVTVKQLSEKYLGALAQAGKGTDRLEALWRLHILPEFGSRRLSEVRGADIERWHRALPKRLVEQHEQERARREALRQARRAEIEAASAVRRRGPTPKPRAAPPSTRSVTGHRTANMCVEALRAAFNWAMSPKRRLFEGSNPAAGHDTFREHERDRFLQPAELQPFFAALAEERNDAVRDFIILALLTGARRSNVAAMAWADVDLDQAIWRVSGELMKNGQPQVITLTPEAVGVLKQRREARKGPWVFPSKTSESGHLVEPRAGWRRVLNRAGLTDLRIHDLRRTLGSWQARTGASLVLIGKSLNHKTQQATAIYARLDLDPVRQSVERATSAMFEAAKLKEPARVAPIGTKKRRA